MGQARVEAVVTPNDDVIGVALEAFVVAAMELMTGSDPGLVPWEAAFAAGNHLRQARRRVARPDRNGAGVAGLASIVGAVFDRAGIHGGGVHEVMVLFQGKSLGREPSLHREGLDTSGGVASSVPVSSREHPASLERERQ